MKAVHELKIEMTREQKETLADAVGILREILSLLKENKDKADGLLIYDDFWKVYDVCCNIYEQKLIPKGE